MWCCGACAPACACLFLGNGRERKGEIDRANWDGGGGGGEDSGFEVGIPSLKKNSWKGKRKDPNMLLKKKKKRNKKKSTLALGDVSLDADVGGYRGSAGG